MGNCAAKRLSAVELYLVSGEEKENEPELVRRAAAGGVTLFQLRAKGVDERALLSRGERLAAACGELDLPLIINDQPRLARRLGAAGLHLGQADGPIAAARDVLGPGFLVGRSTHGVAEARRAEQEGADYIAIGSVFPTSSKPKASPCGLESVAEVLAAVKLPVFAIGGIAAANVAALVTLGLRRVAVISAIWDAPDPEAAAMALTKKLRSKK